MGTLASAVHQLYEDAAWFARAYELRLHAIDVSPVLRNAGVELVPKLEFHADNFSAWYLLEDPHLREDPGWTFRGNRLRQQYQARREAFAKDGVGFPELPAAPASAASGIAYFGATLASIVSNIRDPLRGVVVVLAPTIVEVGTTFDSELEALLSASALRPVRWVVLEAARSPASALCSTLGKNALTTRIVVDDMAQTRELKAMLEAAEPSGGRDLGTAGPRGVTPPRRKNAPPELPPEQLEAALRAKGMDPAYLERAPMLRQKVLGAAVAMKEQRGADAIRLQREARDLCESLGLVTETLLNHLILAGYLLALGQEPMSLREYMTVAEQADQRGAHLQACQARFALGAIHASKKRYADGAREYAAAARGAERAESPPFAIEAWRLAGQVGMQAGAERQAGECWREALRIANGASPDVQKTSSAGEAARQLAAYCQRVGLKAQADSLYAQADAFERGQPADADTSN